MIRQRLNKLAFSGLILAVSATLANAQDISAVAERIKSGFSAQGVEMAWTGLSGDASSMVIQGLTLKTPGDEDDTLPVGDVTLTGISDRDGGYHIESITTAPLNRTEDGVTVAISPFVLKGMIVPKEGETDPLKSMLFYDSADLDKLSVEVGNTTVFSLDKLGFQMTPPAEGKPIEFTGAAEKFTADLSLVEDPQSKAVIEALGYQTISGFLEIAGSWQLSDGRLALSQYDISVDNAGTFGMTFDLGGYTLDFIKSAQEVSQKMAAQTDGDDNSAAGMAMLGLMQQLTLGGAAVRFEDDSLTGKVLDYLAAQQGATAKDIANQAKALVPFAMAQLNNPELAAQVSAAVNAFLDNPKSIEIAAAPASPVPFAMIAASGMSNPLDLPKTLGVKVTANQ